MNGNTRKYRVRPIAFVAIVGVLAAFLLAGCEQEETETTVTSIEATTLPARSPWFYAGEPFDPTGLVLTVSKSDGTSEHVIWAANTGITMDPDRNEELEAGTQTVTVGYEGASDTFEIDVHAPADVASVALASGPDDRYYDVGDAFDATGLTVTVTDGYGISRDVVWTAGNHDFALSPSNGAVFETSDTEGVSVYYKGKKTEVPVEVDDIIIAGYQTIGNVQTAGYWKNGIFTMLGNGDDNSAAYCHAVDESGDVYVGGYQYSGSYVRGGYWDPYGNFHPLYLIDGSVQSNETSYVNDMLFHDGTLVMGGRAYDYGNSTDWAMMLWTETARYGTVMNASTTPKFFGALFEGPSGIEACGAYSSEGYFPRYHYSIGSAPTNYLASTLPYTAKNSLAYDGYWDKGSEFVYLCGTDTLSSKLTAVLWKGMALKTTLGDPALGISRATGVTVVDGEAYACGYQYAGDAAQTEVEVAGFWQPLSGSSSYEFVPVGNAAEGDSVAYYIEANGAGDIYCYGSQVIAGIQVAGYWKPDAESVSGYGFVELGNGIKHSRIIKQL